MSLKLSFAYAVTAVALVMFPTTGRTAPNVVLVMCDDLGWGDVGFNGGQIIQTPHLDAWAADSLVFNRFYAAAPVCSPTRGSCLTGRHPRRLAIPFANQGHLRDSEITLAELLRQSGYRTGHFGKWHLGTLTQTVKDSNRGGIPEHAQHFAPPQDHGFDVCFSTEARVPTYDPMLGPRLGREAQRPPDSWNPITDPAKSIDFGTRYWNDRGEIVTDNLDGDDSQVVMDRVIPFIEQAAAEDQPFFAVIWFHAPHLPVVASDRHRAIYPEAAQPLHQNYYGCVTALDEQMGRLRTTLQQLELDEETMLWFCSDNGPEGGPKAPGSTGPYRGRKRSLYEGGIRVPAFVHWPTRIRAGRSTQFPAVTSDYLPTVLAVVGESLSDSRPIDGISLVPVIDGEVTVRDAPIGFTSRQRAAWIGDRFKLVGNAATDRWQLFDLLNDPGEQDDLAASNPGLVKQLREELTAWRASCERSAQGGDDSR